jgi:PST family polysaccharide transporter
MELSNQPGTRDRAAKGALFTGAAQVYRVVVGFASSVLLARLLTPADFGLIAMVSSCIALVSLIQDLGLNQATIQRERISQAQTSALFWLSFGFSVTLALALAVCAPAVAWFFKDSRLTGLTIAFAFLVVLGGSQSQQLAVLNRELRFKALAGIDVASVTASTIAGVGVAWLTSSYWALFIAGAASTIVSLVCAWTLGSFWPGRPSFEGDFREFLHFGSGVSGFNILNYLSRNADNLLIGKFYGGEQLGYYDRAYRMFLFPLSQILGPLGRVMLPVLARLRSNPERYRKAYTESISLLMIATQPGLVFAIVFAEDVFSILLGPHWILAAPIFRWLGVAGLHQIMTSTVGWLYMSQGRGGDFFKIGLFGAVTTVTSFVLGLPWGPLGVAIAYTIANYVVLLPATWWSTGRHGPVSTRDLLAAAIPHVVGTSMSAVVMISIASVINTPSFLDCVALVTLSYLVYGLVLTFFPQKRSVLGENLRMLGRMLRFI